MSNSPIIVSDVVSKPRSLGEIRQLESSVKSFYANKVKNFKMIFNKEQAELEEACSDGKVDFEAKMLYLDVLNQYINDVQDLLDFDITP
jgi:hypothetical protein